jgi:hypothetical protein
MHRKAKPQGPMRSKSSWGSPDKSGVLVSGRELNWWWSQSVMSYTVLSPQQLRQLEPSVHDCTTHTACSIDYILSKWSGRCTARYTYKMVWTLSCQNDLGNVLHNTYTRRYGMYPYQMIGRCTGQNIQLVVRTTSCQNDLVDVMFDTFSKWYGLYLVKMI